MSEAERAEAALGRARAAIESVDEVLAEGDGDRARRAEIARRARIGRLMAPAPEPPQRPQDRATVPVSPPVQSGPVPPHLRAFWDFIADVMGKVIAAERDERHDEQTALRAEIIRATGDLLGMQRASHNAEVAKLRREIADMRAQLETQRQPEAPVRRLRRVK